jgi:hypothetical protein
MKIKTKTLVNFLKKARMEGDQQINECILHFQKEGMKMNVNSPSQQARTISWLKTSAFKEYEEIGKVGVNDMVNMIKVLDRFGEIITLTVTGNLMSVKSEGKSVDIELVAESFLSTDTGEPNLEFTDTFTIPASKIAEVIKDVSLNDDAVITIQTEDKKVKISNTGKYKFVHEIAAPTVKGGVIVKLGEPFINAVINLDANLELSIRSDYPVKIMEKTDDSIITLIVAPRVDDKEE